MRKQGLDVLSRCLLSLHITPKNSTVEGGIGHPLPHSCCVSSCESYTRIWLVSRPLRTCAASLFACKAGFFSYWLCIYDL